MNTQRDINLTFISSKGFDIYTADGLYKALHWLQTADADNLMYGEPSGDEFDIMVGEMRRPMLISSVEAAIAELSLSEGELCTYYSYVARTKDVL